MQAILKLNIKDKSELLRLVGELEHELEIVSLRVDGKVVKFNNKIQAMYKFKNKKLKKRF